MIHDKLSVTSRHSKTQNRVVQERMITSRLEKLIQQA